MEGMPPLKQEVAPAVELYPRTAELPLLISIRCCHLVSTRCGTPFVNQYQLSSLVEYLNSWIGIRSCSCFRPNGTPPT